MKNKIFNLGKILQNILFSYGFIFDLIRPSNQLEKSLLLLLTSRGITSLIDIGANKGQFAKRIRILGYKGDLLCIEPIVALQKDLEKIENKYPKTKIMTGIAVSDKSGIQEFNISKNSVSSSLNNINSRHIISAPGSENVATQKVEVMTLLDLIEGFADKEALAIKIDVQGHENILINDIKKSELGAIKIILVELSRVQLYENSQTDKELVPVLEEMGFELYSLNCGFSDTETGEMLQYDAIYVRD